MKTILSIIIATGLLTGSLIADASPRCKFIDNGDGTTTIICKKGESK